MNQHSSLFFRNDNGEAKEFHKIGGWLTVSTGKGWEEVKRKRGKVELGSNQIKLFCNKLERLLKLKKILQM